MDPLHLMGIQITQFGDLVLLATYVRANRYENDPKEQCDGAYRRNSWLCDSIVECKLQNHAGLLNLSKTQGRPAAEQSPGSSDQSDMFGDQYNKLHGQGRLHQRRISPQTRVAGHHHG